MQIAALPKEHSHTNPSSREVLHNRRSPTKGFPILFEILFWLLQCKSVSSSAGELKNSTVVFYCASANPMAVPILYCINRLYLYFYLLSLLPHWYKQMLFWCKALQNESGCIGTLLSSLPEPY